MYKFSLLNYKFNSITLLILSYLLIISEVDKINNLFFLLLLSYAFFQKNFNYKFKKIFSSFCAIITLFILFVIYDYTLSKEYFISLILALIFLKYSEIEKKEDHYFFNFSCVFLAISSLIYGQDLISSILSFLLTILSIIHLYSLNQTKILSINVKNIFKYLIFSFSIIPIIAIVYFLFPRAELNIKLFETKKNELGIPDKISLGSFNDISDSDQNVFIYSDNINEVNQKLYFRVKVFDKLNEDKDWINTEYKILLSQFKNNFKIIGNQKDENIDASILMFPHEKKWLPKLSDFNFDNSELNLNLINNTISTNTLFSKKKSYNLIYDKKKIIFDEKIIKYYTQLPNSISPRFNEWVEKNIKLSDNEEEYLERILDEFKNNNFFYSLTPEDKGNDYENFFFNTKNGYCEYYAGTFSILTRLAGIPSRVVTGYFGGSFNELGKFYTFKQQDAHSWVEVLIDGIWRRYDPTLSVPNENIVNSNNANFESLNSSVNNSLNNNIDTKFFKVGIYFDYMNYIWTNSFLQYDEKSRGNFIKKYLSNSGYINLFLGLIILSIIFILFVKIIIFIYNKNILFRLFFTKININNKDSKKNLTHQEIFKNLNQVDKLKFKELFILYEKTYFDKKQNISFKDFYNFNFKILKYAYFKK